MSKTFKLHIIVSYVNSLMMILSTIKQITMLYRYPVNHMQREGLAIVIVYCPGNSFPHVREIIVVKVDTIRITPEMWKRPH